MNIETLHDNEWVSLKQVVAPEYGVNGYVFSHETRCQGRIIAVLPWRTPPKQFMGNTYQYLIKSEVTPCWSLAPVRSAITGGWEGGDPLDDVVREMHEETGYSVLREDVRPLGQSYASKSSDTIYDLFTIDLTNYTQGEALGDGSRLESEAITEWLNFDELVEVMDPQVLVMATRINYMRRF